MPTTTLATIRQKVAKKIYAARFPIVSATTSDSDSLTVLIDSLLAPAAQVEDYVESWIFVAEQPTKVDSGRNINEGGTFSASDTTLTVTTNTTPFTVGDGIQIDDEVMRVTNISTPDLTVVRGIQGTTAATHVDGSDIYIIGPAVGEIARVTDVDFSGTNSKLTLAPALSASLVSGTDYEIHYKFYPNHVRDKANEILENIRRAMLTALTLVPDGAMEDTGTVSTYWTAAGTGGTPTLAKNTSTVLHGRQTLSITNDGSTTLGYAKSNSMYLRPGTSVFVAADCYITGGDSAKLTLYDVTNSAAIDTAESAATGWVHFAFTANLPATCEEVAIWLESPAVSDVTYWGSVQLLPTDRVIYDYPGVLEWSEDLDKVVYFPRGVALAASTDDNAYTVFEKPQKLWSPSEMLRDETAVTAFRLQLKKGGIDQALYVGGFVDYATLTDDTDTTAAPEDIIVNLTYADLMDAWAQEDIAEDKFEAAQAKTKKADNIRRLLGPRMMHFWKPKGRVSGARR